MDIKLIIIIVLVIIIIGLGVVSFVPFGGKLLLCSSNVSNIVSASNCSIAGYISKSDCPEGEATEESCQSFIKEAISEMPVNEPEAFYTETWCKGKYKTLATPVPAAAISTTSKFCTDVNTALITYLASLATKFNSIRLIKATQGTTMKFFYDPASTAVSPSPVTLTVAAIEAPAYTGKTITDAAIFALLKTAEFDKMAGEIRTPVMEHISAALGITTNNDRVSVSGSVYVKTANYYTGTSVQKYTAIPSLWKTIGSGSSWTYSYLDLTSSNQTAILNELKKKDISRYATLCL
jgi:hypothetical protein